MKFKVTDEDVGQDGIVDVKIVSGDWNDTFVIRFSQFNFYVYT